MPVLIPILWVTGAVVVLGGGWYLIGHTIHLNWLKGLLLERPFFIRNLTRRIDLSGGPQRRNSC